jgi:UTP--glucose-1-phosphate uridylyltransferase
VIAVQDVPRAQTSSYGIVATDDFEGRAGRIQAMVEKPKPELAPSTLGVVGRYILGPDIFETLRATTPGAGGEIQLTDAIAARLAEHKTLAYRFAGTRFDCGSHIGLIQATIRFALDHEKLSASAQSYMRQALEELSHNQAPLD